MTTENLSDKIESRVECLGCGNTVVCNRIHLQDVREAVKKLKEKVRYMFYDDEFTSDRIIDEIDEIFGSKLT